MAVTQKDLEAQQKKNDKLREQIEAQLQKAAETVQDRSNEIDMAQLQAEENRLTAQLEAAKAAAQVAAKKESTAATLPDGEVPAPVTEKEKS